MAFNSADALINSTKDLYLLKYKNKSDEELEQIRSHLRNVSILSSNHSEALSALGEMNACSELLQQRYELSRYMKNLERNLTWASSFLWESAIVERRQNALLNLPGATSYHGQLIAAVLDEESDLTADEIRQWSSELADMDDTQYHALLKQLVEERIIVVEDGEYSLLTLCTPDLHPSDPMLWANHHKLRSNNAKLFLEKMIETKKPLTEWDWINLCGSESEKQEMAENPKVAFQSIKFDLSFYVSKGIFSITPLADLDWSSWLGLDTKEIPAKDLCYYYLPILGEKEAE